MKQTISKFLQISLFSGALLAAGNLLASDIAVSSQTSTTSVGTISEFGPDRLMIRTESSPDPIRYTYNKTTTYVDEAGKPVSMELVKSGLPVTVYYTTVDGAPVASKVMVRKVAVTETPVINEKKTTTTTTTRD